MVNVCDAIMGTGKTTAAIAYMNEHKDRKFIYITPYLDEAARIKECCPDLKFVEPSNQIRKYGNQKYLHTAALIEQGKNISTTHQAFKLYTPDMLDNVRKHGYTLFIDENVDMLEKVEADPEDIQMAVDAGYIACNDGVYSIINQDYHGAALSDVFRILKSRGMIRIDGESDDLFFWVLPPDLLTSFDDVFILTYLFEGQSLHHLLRMNDIQYQNIGIQKTSDGLVFGSLPGYIPEYVHSLKDMIDIYDGKLNGIGNDWCDLSRSWTEKYSDDGLLNILKNNIYNYFRNIWADAGSERRLWSTHKSCFEKLKGRGYSSAFLPFNIKATNQYRDRDILVYAVNIFMNVPEKLYYMSHGIDVDEDAFALSIMVQWIWRSAIRDGKKIHIYIPSRRMRTLLINWIENVSNGGKV